MTGEREVGSAAIIETQRQKLNEQLRRIGYLEGHLLVAEGRLEHLRQKPMGTKGWVMLDCPE